MTGESGSSVLRFMTCGSVDDGKSTLIGHLLYDTGNVLEDQFKTLVEESRRIGNAGDHIDYSLLLDGLIAEREQGITIDVAYRYFRTPKRKYIVADTPGHEGYTRNMAVAASNSTAALILIDARNGVLTQTRRHFLICALSGIRHICFAVNKMGTVDWSADRYYELQERCAGIVGDAARFGLDPQWTAIPVSALWGDNLTEASPNMRWYTGRSILDWLESVPADAHDASEAFRFAVQYVIKPGSNLDRWQGGAETGERGEEAANYRSYAGRVLAGRVSVGDAVAILPSGQRTAITAIQGPGGKLERAESGMSVALRVADKLDITRGDGIVPVGARLECSDQFKARIVWMQSEPLFAGRAYIFKSAFGKAIAEVTKVVDRIDLDTYLPLEAERLELNELGEVEIALNRLVPFDPYEANKWSGSFLLVDRRTNATAGSGMIEHGLRRADNVHWQAFTVDKAARERLKQQRACVLWFTGLSGAGKSTIANLVERRLYSLGRHTMILDGDNVRHGLNKDLGFTEQDRIENIRRAGEAAKLLTEAGLIVLVCFISPYRSDRDAVRSLFAADEFHEVFVDAPLDVCETRDPKGLYKKARSGAIPNFTGINAPYEAPLSPELRLDTGEESIEESVERVMAYLSERGTL